MQSLSWAAYSGQGRAARFLLMKVPFDLVSLVTLDGQMPSDLASSQGYHKVSELAYLKRRHLVAAQISHEASIFQ